MLRDVRYPTAKAGACENGVTLCGKGCQPSLAMKDRPHFCPSPVRGLPRKEMRSFLPMAQSQGFPLAQNCMAESTQGTGSEARLLTDERFLRKVAYFYYEDGQSQEAIAETEFCSRQTISKALQKARDRGIVRISIVPDLH